MKTAVFITAVTGSGKSTVCRSLRELGYQAYDLELLPGLYELVDEKTGKVLPGSLEQITDDVDWRCNKDRLQILVDKSVEGLTFYCGGMSNTEEVWDIFDKIIILTVSDETTVERLSSRAAGEFGSTEENRKWVLSWKHGFERRLLSRGVAVSAEGTPFEVAEAVLKAIQ